MLNKEIKFLNFNYFSQSKKKKTIVRNILNTLLKENNQILESMKKNYQDSYNQKIILNCHKINEINVIGMGGSALGAKAIYSFLKSLKKKFNFFDNISNKKIIKNKKKSINLIISKSGDTLEKISNSNLLLKKKILEKTIIVTKDRLTKCGINNFFERKCEHSVKALSYKIRESMDENVDIILIFGATAITDIDDIVPKSIKKNDGKVTRLGMPVEPGNLMLLGNLKKSNKNIPVVGMPGCARSPKENGVDWILWRLFSEIDVSSEEINDMGNGGLL